MSGGEKIRLAFARLFIDPPNFLLLDEPTANLDLRARREFLRDMEDHGDDDDADDNRVVRAVQADTLELIEETDSHWVFSFVPRQDEDFMSELEATLRIAKDGRHIESLEMTNRGDIDAGFGTTLSNFIVKLGTELGSAPRNEAKCLSPLVDALLELRQNFRADKQWAAADAIRDILQEANITIEDDKSGSLWVRAVISAIALSLQC